MSAVLLSLVPAAKRLPRPFQTFYYGPRAKSRDWSHRGRAASLRGATLAAMRQLLDRRAVYATIENEAGVVVLRLDRTATSIRVTGIEAIPGVPQ